MNKPLAYSLILIIISIMILATSHFTSQSRNIKKSISTIKHSFKTEGYFTPLNGKRINFTNNEFIIIDLHHQTNGFVIAYSSDESINLIKDYQTIYPAYEAWVTRLHANYHSKEDFFNKNADLNWVINKN
ncbi:hypothetical protein [Marinicellulosiphila megalodicopiae]|uniref:hypothetical protein n=1 Tax=Marinicellulosiphila megalodicopiae TaxID=2724896 RepID=UPI003BAF3331